MDTKKLINDYIDSQRDNMIADLRTLVKIPSVMGEAKEDLPFGKYPALALEAALTLCQKSGFYTSNVNNYMGEADFFADKEDHLGILCHMDVVPEGSGWKYNPFDVTEADGKLFGRGTIDDKGPAIAALYAMKAVKELDLPIEKNIRLLLGTNEENGSADLAFYRKKKALPPLLFTPDGSYPLINIEKGMLRIRLESEISDNRLKEIKGGNAVNAVPEYAEAAVSEISVKKISEAAKKLSLSAKFEATEENGIAKISVYGKSAHASTPESGKNALTALIELLSELGISCMDGYKKLFPYGETDGRSCGIKCSDDISGETTTVLSVAEISDGKLIFRQDIRFPVCESCNGITEKLSFAASKYGIKISADMKSEPHNVPSDSDLVKTLLSVYEDITGEKGVPAAIGGGTYVHDTENGVAFGAEFPDEDNHMHGADEFITVENLLLNAKIYANAIYKICGKGV